MAIAYKKPQIPNVPAILETVRDVAVEVMHERTREFAHTERDRFVSDVKRQRFQSFNMYPLTTKYYKRKVAKNRDTRVMLATGHMMRSVKVMERKDSKLRTTIHVGFERLALARDLDNRVVYYPLYKVAMVQEKGSSKMKIPPRPHWKPHLEAMRGRALDVRKLIKKDIRSEALRRVGAPLRGR